MASLKKRPQQKNRPWVVRWREGTSNRSRGFRLREEAKAFLTEALAIEQAHRDGQHSAPSALRKRTLDEQWPVWQESRVNTAEATRAKHEWAYQKWLRPTLADRRLGSLTHHDLNTVLAQATKAGRGPDTRIAIYQALNMLLDDALGADGHNCRRAVAGTSKRKREVRNLTDDEVELLLAVVPEKWRLLVDTLATMGLRPHEAIGLRAQDVSDGSLVVRAKKGRSQNTRILPLPDHLRRPLTDLAATMAPSDLLWTVPDWRVWRRRVWGPAVKDAQLTGLTPYDLRHRCASKLIAAGATPVDVAAWMGHSVTMTLSVYGHLFEGRMPELSALLNREEPAPDDEGG